MKLFGNTGGVFSTNSFLLIDDDSKQAVIFDAPNDTTGPLLDAVTAEGAHLIGLWLTHGHIDHIADHAMVTAKFPDAKVLIHPLDESKLQNPNSMFPVPFKTAARKADAYLSDGQILKIGRHEVHVIATPGHSPGHVGFYIPSAKLLVGGDLILMGAVGRTDFADCSFPDLEKSLRTIMKLPGDTQLLPGHGEPSRLRDEVENNPYIRAAMNKA